MPSLTVLPILVGNEDHLLGQDRILTGPGGWSGRFFGKAEVHRGYYRENGLALIGGEDARELLYQLQSTPDPVAVVLYYGDLKAKALKPLEKAVKERSGARLVTRKFWVQAEIMADGGPILNWYEQPFGEGSSPEEEG